MSPSLKLISRRSDGFRPKRDAHRAIPLIRPAKDAVKRIRADIAAISESTHRKRGRGYKAYPYKHLYGTLGLY